MRPRGQKEQCSRQRDPELTLRGSTHSPGAFVVKEEDKEELLSSLGLFLLAQLQHIQGGNRDGDTIVQEALPGHLGVDDLKAEGRGFSKGQTGELCSLLRD